MGAMGAMGRVGGMGRMRVTGRMGRMGGLGTVATLAALGAAVGGALGACGSSAPTAARAAPAASASPAAPAPAPAPAAKPPTKTVQLNAPGEPVDINAQLPAGYVTVVDFWSQSCEACIKFGQMLDTGVAEDPRVVIRKIDVGDGFTPVAQAYNIATLPHFFIYDKWKRLRYDLIGPDCGEASTYARQLAAE
jgi:thiol-disulfide isomerase/thioredoxin